MQRLYQPFPVRSGYVHYVAPWVCSHRSCFGVDRLCAALRVLPDVSVTWPFASQVGGALQGRVLVHGSMS